MLSPSLESSLSDVPIVGILRGYRVAEALIHIDRILDAGVRVIEVTIERPEAVPTLAAAVDLCRARGVLVGAGSVNTVEQLEAAANCAVDFAVSPGLSLAVAEAAERHEVTYIPGVATGTEITAALQAGLQTVKVFPASHMTPSWVTAMQAPFPDARFIATGGLAPGDIVAWLDAGCHAIGLSARNLPASWSASSIERGSRQ